MRRKLTYERQMDRWMNERKEESERNSRDETKKKKRLGIVGKAKTMERDSWIDGWKNGGKRETKEYQNTSPSNTDLSSDLAFCFLSLEKQLVAFFCLFSFLTFGLNPWQKKGRKEE